MAVLSLLSEVAAERPLVCVIDDQRWLDQASAQALGNPLALLELPHGMTPGELAGGYGLPGAGSVTDRIEDSFRRQLDALPDQTRTCGDLPRRSAAILSNALGRYDEARDAARRVAEDPSGLHASLWALPELIEAAARCGNMSMAGEA